MQLQNYRTLRYVLFLIVHQNLSKQINKTKTVLEKVVFSIHHLSFSIILPPLPPRKMLLK